MHIHTPLALPPWTKLGKELESQVRKALYEFELVEGVQKLAIALSGGKDSLSMLYLLKAISGRGFHAFDLVAITVSGDATCGASIGNNFLQNICDALDVPLIDCPSSQTLDSLECYSCSRERRKLLFEAAKKAGCTHIAFGHHQDDNVQTLLMNLLHKGEFCGQLPKLEMVDFDITIIRPLIYVRESQIVAFSKMYGFNRITCRCPVGQRSLRKKTELLLQDIETLYPNARKNLAHAVHTYGSKKAIKKRSSKE
jgi:tRNA 2-thiocytidine biosynthesis protein TtcA